jgi:hypothetical protein
VNPSHSTLPAQSTLQGVGETGARASSVSFHGDGEDEVTEDLLTSPQQDPAAGLAAPALADALGIFKPSGCDLARSISQYQCLFGCCFIAMDLKGVCILA